MSKKNILFVGLHRPNRTPSQRFRFEQYVDFLNQSGFNCVHKFLLNEKDDKVYYSSGKFISKAIILFKSIIFLLKESSKNSYDTVFVQREAFMLGTAFFEKRFAKRAKLIYDLDDSIWMHQTGEIKSNNRFLYFLKNPNKTKTIIGVSDVVFAGNQYIADFALKHNPNVVIIPTTIDTDIYTPCTNKDKEAVCVGWSGSFSTIIHFTHVIPALLQIKKKYQNRVRFKVIGDGTYSNPELDIQGIPWSMANELQELCEIHIGLMPLPDDDWTKGKCGLKGLQYMALEIPCIMSPVGVNSEIIQDGTNGFLATSEDEWVSRISILIENPDLRTQMGISGRITVVEAYSVQTYKSKYIELLGG